MKEEIEFKRLRYVKAYLYSSFIISFLLILGSGASVFGYKKFAPGFEFVSLFGGLIGTQISVAILLMVQDLEGKRFKEPLNFSMIHKIIENRISILITEWVNNCLIFSTSQSFVQPLAPMPHD